MTQGTNREVWGLVLDGINIGLFRDPLIGNLDKLPLLSIKVRDSYFILGKPNSSPTTFLELPVP